MRKQVNRTGAWRRSTLVARHAWRAFLKPKSRNRALLVLFVALLALIALAGEHWIGHRGQAAIGFLVFLGIAIACSANIGAIKLRTLLWGIGLQVSLALFVIKLEIGGRRIGEQLFLGISDVVKRFLAFSEDGARFVFGDLADSKSTFIFAFSALPTIVFVSAFFSLLHYLGITRVLVAITAAAMKRLMHTSGAETLAAVENVFMGQSEAPLIVRAYLPGMTCSELHALMTGGMATLSGGMIAVYIGMGADPVALLASGIMSAPCSLYVAKLLVPETAVPLTLVDAVPARDEKHTNVLDAIASGATTGIALAINITAMIIAFLAFLALIDYMLQLVMPGLSLQAIFAWLFNPIAVLIGIESADAPTVASLLGTKLVGNEFLAFAQLTKEPGAVSPRSLTLATFALSGFANFSSVGIQLGAMGSLAPQRRADIARLGGRALFGGFLATLLNASIAGFLLS